MKDEQGRTIGTVHDFLGWCILSGDHEFHSAGRMEELSENEFANTCGAPVALVGDIENWKPTGFLNG